MLSGCQTGRHDHQRRESQAEQQCRVTAAESGESAELDHQRAVRSRSEGRRGGQRRAAIARATEPAPPDDSRPGPPDGQLEGEKPGGEGPGPSGDRRQRNHRTGGADQQGSTGTARLSLPSPSRHAASEGSRHPDRTQQADELRLNGTVEPRHQAKQDSSATGDRAHAEPGGVIASGGPRPPARGEQPRGAGQPPGDGHRQPEGGRRQGIRVAGPGGDDQQDRGGEQAQAKGVLDGKGRQGSPTDPTASRPVEQETPEVGELQPSEEDHGIAGQAATAAPAAVSRMAPSWADRGSVVASARRVATTTATTRASPS